MPAKRHPDEPRVACALEGQMTLKVGWAQWQQSATQRPKGHGLQCRQASWRHLEANKSQRLGWTSLSVKKKNSSLRGVTMMDSKEQSGNNLELTTQNFF